MASTRLTARGHALVLAGSAVLTALFTYPLILDPGHLLPDHKDPLMYGWTMVSNVHRLLSAPLAVFHGNTFYPNGNSVAYTDLLLTPTLFPAGPVYLLTGNPVLQYNVALLVWWGLSAWAMYVLAFAVLRSHPAAALASIVFAFCPFRTDFFLEFQMELAFPIPLAVLCLWRFLEGRRWPDIFGVVVFVWLEALASMYYAIILGLCLIVVAGLSLLLRPGWWGWRLVGRATVGGLVLGAALAPFLVPYVQNFRELHMERALRQLPNYSADVMTYFETGPTRLYTFSPTGHTAETSLFMGFVALTLAALACILPDEASPAARPGPSLLQSRLRNALTLALAVTLAGLVVRLAASEALGAHRSRVLPGPQSFLSVMLVLGFVRMGLEGWWATRAGQARAPLGARALGWICLFLVALFVDLSLGPFIQYRRQELGRGLYYYLYRYLLPLHAMRITSRIGVIVVLAIALLAGLGLRNLLARIPCPRVRMLAASLAVLLLLVEYAPFPLPYSAIAWEQPPPVYGRLAAEPDDVAVLEWPQGSEDWDDYYTFMSITHWKRITNGASGFLPDLTRDLSLQLDRPDIPGDPFPSPEALRYLLGIHPLRYVVVHNAALEAAERAKWRKLREQSWAEYLGPFGADDLYRLTGDVQGTEVTKLFSWDYARTRREISFEVRPLGSASRGRWVEVELNGRRLGRQDVDDGWTRVTLPLGAPLHQSAPNAVTIRWHYRSAANPAGRVIGRTGVRSPADLRVVSGGQPHGDRASIMINGVEHAGNQRGYNLVTLDPASGEVGPAELFDTCAIPDASRRLAAAIQAVPAGRIVIASVKDEASQQLTREAVEALRSIGASQDLRGRFRASHLVIGVKGAPPGAAIERIGDAPLEVVIGTPPATAGMALRRFSLR